MQSDSCRFCSVPFAYFPGMQTCGQPWKSASTFPPAGMPLYWPAVHVEISDPPPLKTWFPLIAEFSLKEVCLSSIASLVSSINKPPPFFFNELVTMSAKFSAFSKHTFFSWRLTPWALFKVKLQFLKVPFPISIIPAVTLAAPPCKQVERTNQPHTQPHRNNSQSMHAFIHSFNPPYSLYHSFTRTNQASPLPFITIIHPSINHALHGPLSMAFVHARITLSWLAHNGMYLPPPYRETYIYTCMHAWRWERQEWWWW